MELQGYYAKNGESNEKEHGDLNAIFSRVGVLFGAPYKKDSSIFGSICAGVHPFYRDFQLLEGPVRHSRLRTGPLIASGESGP